MIDLFNRWFQQRLSNPQVIYLILVMSIGLAVILVAGEILAPVLASLVLAYLLDDLVLILTRRGVARLIAVLVVFLSFLVLYLLLLLGMLPLLSQQVTQLLRELPNMVALAQSGLMQLPEMYPAVFSEQQVQDLSLEIRSQITGASQNLMVMMTKLVSNLITLLVYAFLIPMMIFFFVKDKPVLLRWFSGHLPDDRSLMTTVWHEVDGKLDCYVGGKLFEIFLVGLCSYILFFWMDLPYSLLLSVVVGLSVIIPYIGATVVTIPVAAVAFVQFGIGQDFFYIMIGYGIIQALDGNLLVPLLFSEVVNLHPLAIIIGVLFFGGLWGFWGVFFAIPLVTVISAVLNAWSDATQEVEIR